MNMFEEIDREKKELPKIHSLEKEVGKYTFNWYQKFSIVTYIVCFCLGIIFGNLFPACSSSTTMYSNSCLTTEFNFSLMIFFWFASFLLCLFFFALGHIISLLTSIDKKMSKRS